MILKDSYYKNSNSCEFYFHSLWVCQYQQLNDKFFSHGNIQFLFIVYSWKITTSIISVLESVQILCNFILTFTFTSLSFHFHF